MNLDLNAIEARAKAATPGPWGWYDPPGAGYGPQIESEEQHARWGGMACVLVTAEVCSACRERGAPCLSGKQEDKDFIAHAREDIPALTAEVRRLNAYIEERQLINPEAEIRRLKAQLETEILRRDSLGETLDNVVADHKRDIARLADIKAKAEPIVKAINAIPASEYNTILVMRDGTKLRIGDLRALATALEGE